MEQLWLVHKDGCIISTLLTELYDGFFFDMDGVLYLGNTPIPGAPRTLSLLRQLGKHVGLVTNNSGQSTATVIRRLESLGFSAEHIDVVVATSVTAEWLAEQKPGGSAYVLGASELRREIERAGLTVFAGPEAPQICDFIVVGNDRSVDYTSLHQAIRLGRAGAKFVAVNRDPLYPVQDRLVPGADPLVSAIACGIEREPDIVIGKPSLLLIQRALARSGLPPDRCIMIGDTVDIDIRMGSAAGLATALVLTGVDNLDTVGTYEVQPTYVLNSVADIVEHIPL